MSVDHCVSVYLLFSQQQSSGPFSFPKWTHVLVCVVIFWSDAQTSRTTLFICASRRHYKSLVQKKKKKRLISCDNTIVKFRIKRVRGTSYMGSNDEMRRFVGMVDGWMDDHGQALRKSDGCMENSHVLLMHPTSQPNLLCKL